MLIPQNQVDRIIGVLAISFGKEPFPCLHADGTMRGWSVVIAGWTITSDQSAVSSERMHVVRYANKLDESPHDLALAALSPIVADGMIRILESMEGPRASICGECQHAEGWHIGTSRGRIGVCITQGCKCRRFVVAKPAEEK